VEIWLASLDDVDLEPAAGAFSAAELARADRIASAGRRHRFLSRRWVARALLARASGGVPNELVLERRCDRCGGLHPASPLAADSGELWWSATSSAGLAALAIAPRRVGLDLERQAERPRREGIARRFYREEERRAVAGSAARFLEFWTLKEAYLKALGQGLPGGLDALDCTLLGPAEDGWSASAEHPGWRFRNLELEPGFVAALALEGESEDVRLRNWTELSPSPA
jgi:4'-phosphopantetheinyl transferase